MKTLLSADSRGDIFYDSKDFSHADDTSSFPLDISNSRGRSTGRKRSASGLWTGSRVTGQRYGSVLLAPGSAPTGWSTVLSAVNKKAQKDIGVTLKIQWVRSPRSRR